MLPKNDIERLQVHQLLDLAKFVVTENFKHHTNHADHFDYKKEINCVLKEEQKYFENAQLFVSRDLNRSIVGSIRVLKWNHHDTLPLEKIFSIHPSRFNEGNRKQSMWHIGRFAINKSIRNIKLFKQLMICAIAPICNDKNALAYAECDSKLLKVLPLMGINARRMGQSVYYLGSETIPIYMTFDDLIGFYTKNKGLVPANFLKQKSMYQKPLKKVNRKINV